MCGESVNQSGPLVWEFHQDASTPPVDAWYSYQYPRLSMSSLVARNDGSLRGSGTNVLWVFGLSSGNVWYEKGNQVGSQGDQTGPHPFIFDIDAAGQSATLQSMGQVGWSQQYLNNFQNPNDCGGWCEKVEDYVMGPHLWLAGGNVGMVREQWRHGPQFGGPSVTTCEFGELTKSGAPSWSLGTAEVCAMQPRGIAGDDAGNTWIPNGAGITQYDPAGQVVQTLPNPFSGMPGHFVLGPQGEFYVAGHDLSGIRLAKADASGTLQWSKNVSNTDPSSMCFSYAVDGSGNILLTFSSESVVDLGNGPLPRLGQNDLVLAKLDPQGNVTWAKRFGGGGFIVKSCSLRRTGSDDFAMVLDYAGMVDLGDGVLPSSPVLAKFDATGAILWHTDLTSHFPFVAEYQSWALSGHPSGAVFVSGASHAPNPVNWWEPRDLRFVVAKYAP
jgi:hypothetical protein